MPVGEAFRLPFIEIKPFGREGRPLPYKIQHPDKSKFEEIFQYNKAALTGNATFFVYYPYALGAIREGETMSPK